MTYLDELSKLCDNQPVTTSRVGIESYMCKPMEEGLWAISTLDSQSGQYELVSQFSLVCMPGCCGIVISTGVSVREKYQRRGIGTLLNQMRIQMAWELGYTVMACTDVADNVPQQKILQDMNWDAIWEFKNRRTDNNVILHMTDLVNTRMSLGFSPYSRG